MIKLKKGICVKCQETADNLGVDAKEKYFANNAKKLCKYHNDERKRLSSTKKTKSYVRKATGEAEIFKEIWEEREHVSFIDGTPLGDEMNAWYFAHVIPKSSYSGFRLKKENIVLLTKQQHQLWDFASHKIKTDEKWDKLRILKDKLKKEYNDERRVSEK